MKTTLFSILLFLSFQAQSQLCLIQQTTNVTGGNSVYDLETLYNDILYTRTTEVGPIFRGLSISNGSSETSYEISGLDNLEYSFEDFSREPSIIDNDVFLFISRFKNHTDEHRIYRLNDLRTEALLVTTATGQEGFVRTSNNKIVKHNKENYDFYDRMAYTIQQDLIFS